MLLLAVEVERYLFEPLPLLEALVVKYLSSLVVLSKKDSLLNYFLVVALDWRQNLDLLGKVNFFEELMYFVQFVVEVVEFVVPFLAY